MNQNIVIAQVGISKYQSTDYEMVQSRDKIRTKSYYSFEAVAKEALRRSNSEELQIVLAATKDSALGSMLDEKVFSAEHSFTPEKILIKEVTSKYSAYKRIENIMQEDVRIEFENEVSRRLTEHFRRDDTLSNLVKVRLKLLIIDYGIDDKQLSNNFEVISKNIKDMIRSGVDVDLYFDISYGFRSFPIYIYTLINYLSRIEGIKANFHMYYGMYDGRDYFRTYREEKNERVLENNITPLVDLRAIDNLMLLINGINEFRTCGSVIQICSILQSHPEWDIIIGETERKKKVRLSDAFRLFDYGTNGNNLAAIEESVRLLKQMKTVLQQDHAADISERLLLNDISEDFEERFNTTGSKCPYTKFMLELAQWYQGRGRNGNAAIAAQEATVTYFLECYPNEANLYLERNMKGYNGPYNFEDTEYLFEYKLRNSLKK